MVNKGIVVVQIQTHPTVVMGRSKERKWDISRWKWAGYWRLKPLGSRFRALVLQHPALPTYSVLGTSISLANYSIFMEECFVALSVGLAYLGFYYCYGQARHLSIRM